MAAGWSVSTQSQWLEFPRPTERERALQLALSGKCWQSVERERERVRVRERERERERESERERERERERVREREQKRGV